MLYKGHVENGMIVLDEPSDLKNGDKVRVELVESSVPFDPRFPLRDTPYEFHDPFSPAISGKDWDAIG